MKTPFLRQPEYVCLPLFTYPCRTPLPPVVAGHPHRHVHSHHGQGRIPRGTRRGPDHPIYHVYQRQQPAPLRNQIIYIPVLPTLLEARIQIRPDNSLIQLCAANVFQTVQRILMGVVLDEAKSAGGLVVPIQTHN